MADRSPTSVPIASGAVERFEYVDKDVTKGSHYYYRVISYTLDKYYASLPTWCGELS